MAAGFNVAAAAGVIGEKPVVGRIAAGDSVALAGTIGTVDATTMSGRARGSGTLADFGAALAAGFACVRLRGLLRFRRLVGVGRSLRGSRLGGSRLGSGRLGVSAGLAALAFLSSGLASAGVADPPNASAVAITYPRYRR